ncbi:hypothetical protein FOL47_006147 [Perkinsus chesapeaki]|uniref:Uncharacterized protein n=1 Tax=Perkinsus chesapeaki TaxID=330153 RepID=A0A7J6LTR2_PERCH|nr:hypothetical protein FOL47_006147 [Perkinsus chesapeaki]
MPESGVYSGGNEKYYFRWNVRETNPNGRNGRVDIHASRLDLPGVNNITCDDVRYWQGSLPKYTMDLDRDNKDLIELSDKLGINPKDWWGFSHGLHWIEVFGILLTPA